MGAGGVLKHISPSSVGVAVNIVYLCIHSFINSHLIVGNKRSIIDGRTCKLACLEWTLNSWPSSSSSYYDYLHQQKNFCVGFKLFHLMLKIWMVVMHLSSHYL